MLLKLLPSTAPSNASPLTICFTLSLPAHPYSSHSLPLPPALLSHHTLCLQESLECRNVLLGERSTWISAVIQDITFDLMSGTVVVKFIDDALFTLPMTCVCAGELEKVVEQVQLSLGMPRLVAASSTCNTGTRRTPSSLMYSLLSPLLSGSLESRPAKALSSSSIRNHRRQARSILVDTYRRHVLPVLKEHLASGYIPWLADSEGKKLFAKFERLRDDVRSVLLRAHTEMPEWRSRSPARIRSLSMSSVKDDSVCSGSALPLMPASISPINRKLSSSPQSFLSSIPSTESLPRWARAEYADLVSSLAQLASRSTQLRKLGMRYQREEGKRLSLDELERRRLNDKATRRAWSNMDLLPELRGNFSSKPLQRSSLWRLYTADDYIQEQRSNAELEEGSDCESESSDEPLPTTPTSKPNFTTFSIAHSYTQKSTLESQVGQDDCEPDHSADIHPLALKQRLCSDTRPAYPAAMVGKMTLAMESLLLSEPLMDATMTVADGLVDEDAMERYLY
nr:hypothetical protein L203_05452 [Cryptococcus depauperatus CBS 7841]